MGARRIAMRIKAILLASAALCAIGSPPAVSGTHAPQIHVMARHAGAAVKSAIRPRHGTDLTYTFSVSTAVSTKADYKIKTKLAAVTLVTLSNCEPAYEALILSKTKTAYATLGTYTSAYSFGCGTPTRVFGITYDLQTRKAVGKTDRFLAYLTTKLTGPDAVYTGKLNLETNVLIGP
jgi:hypothetical protein